MKHSAKPGCVPSIAPSAHRHGDGGRHRKAVARVVDGGLRQLRKRQLAQARLDRATQADTAPGTVTAFQPHLGEAAQLLKYSSVHAARPRPESVPDRAGSLAIPHDGKPSLPRPQPVGSTTVSAMGGNGASHTALPPASSMRRPACAASQGEVETTLRPMTALRLGVGKGPVENWNS